MQCEEGRKKKEERRGGALHMSLLGLCVLREH